MVAIGFAYQSYFSYKDRTNFPPPGHMIDMGGYALHAQIYGDGNVTVVLDAGMGDSSLVWEKVIPRIAGVATVVTYDRPGLGWSKSSPLPRTSENIVKELRQLLEKVGATPPYALVGHSFGGLNMQLFAKSYPDNVSGLVLVDSAHQNEIERLPATSSIRRALFRAGLLAAPIGVPRAYLSNKGSAEHALKSTTKHQYAYLSESGMFNESAAELNRLPISFGDLPMIIIARNHPSDSSELETSSRRTIEWAKLQEDLSNQSSDSALIFSEKPQHAIHRRQPELVIEAIKAMVARPHREEEKSTDQE